MKNKKNIYYLILVILLVVLDQVTKFLVSNNMTLNSRIEIIPGFFRLYYVTNTGAAFSMLSGQQLLFSLLTPLALIFIIYLFIKETNKTNKIFLVMMFAGAIGNYIDRLVNQEVIDFLSFYNLPIINEFAIFNVADCYLTIGIILYIISELFIKKGNNE